MALTRKQLDELNGTSFPDNDTGDITPDVHRDYNTEVLDYIDEKDGGTLKNASANNFTQQLLNGALRFMGVTNGGTDSVIFYDKDNNAFLVIKAGSSQFGRTGSETVLVSKASDLLHNRESDGSFPIWDAYNLPIATVNELKALLTGALKNASANNYATQQINGNLKFLGDGTNSENLNFLDKNGNPFIQVLSTGRWFGSYNRPFGIVSNNKDITFRKYTTVTDYTVNKLWDSSNLPNPASQEDLNNYWKASTSEGSIASVDELDTFVARKSGVYYVINSSDYKQLTVFRNNQGASASALEIYNDYLLNILKVRTTIQGDRYSPFYDIWTSKSLPNPATKDDVAAKQDTLVSGQNIKTINGQSVVGSGDLVLDVGLNNAFKVVSALPATGDPNYIYLLPKSESESNDSYYEYIWLEDYSRWERIGSTQIDLSDYYTKTQSDARYVRLDSTAQTITGIKTFASLPIVPTVEPSADEQVVSRAWLNKKVQPIQTAVTSLQKDVGDMKPTVTKHSVDISSLNVSVSQLETEVDGKEDKLKSGENIKTINRQSILGAGNIEISGGGSSWNVVEIEVETGQPVPAVNVTGNTIFRAIGSAVNNSLTFNIENPSDTGTSLLKAGESFKVVCYAVIDVTFNAENIGSRMFDLDWESQSGAGTGSESYMEYEITYTGQELLFKRRRFTYANE